MTTKRVKIVMNEIMQNIMASSDFTSLTSRISSLFNIKFEEGYKIYYNDSESDLITVTNQEDYALALSQETELTFYISKNAESARKLMMNVGKPIFSPVESYYEVPEKIAPPVDIYACLGCDGRKTNRKGTKPCNLCSGTGKIPEYFLEKIRDIIRAKLSAEFEPQFIQAASELIEAKQKANLEVVKNMSKSAMYKIELSKKKEDLRSRVIKEIPKEDLKVKPGDDFYKKWVVKNTGTEPWPIDTVFKFAGGDLIQATINHVGKLEPGATIEIRLKGKAPTKLGRYVAYYRLTYGENKQFGEKPWIDVTVTNDIPN